MTAPGGRATRPTPARVKEALFSILGASVDGANVLDLYAGSGALGFESLSRGAAHATFVESHRPTAERLRANARALGIEAQCTIMTSTVAGAARTLRGRYDLVFADPPYAEPFPGDAFATLRERGAIDAESVLVYEHSAGAAAPDDPRFVVRRRATYGAVALAFMRAAA